jgi:hypothetical protein
VKEKGFVPIFAILSVIILGLISYFGYYRYNKIQIAPQAQLVPTPSPQTYPRDSDVMKTYKSPDGLYSFSYPTNWAVLEGVPERFLHSEDTLYHRDPPETWLNEKIFNETCNGPILQKTDNQNVLIVFEIYPITPDGAYCWSYGYGFDDHKWKIAERYVSSGKTYFPEWKGDYSLMKFVASNSKYHSSALLFNYETYNLIGENTFDKIISTFKFTQ